MNELRDIPCKECNQKECLIIVEQEYDSVLIRCLECGVEYIARLRVLNYIVVDDI